MHRMIELIFLNFSGVAFLPSNHRNELCLLLAIGGGYFSIVVSTSLEGTM